MYFRASNSKCCCHILNEGALEPRARQPECQLAKKNVQTYVVIKCEGICCDTWHAPAVPRLQGCGFDEKTFKRDREVDAMRDEIK